MKCCICGKYFEGYGNNPWPVKEKGRCCDDCDMIVIRRRITLYEKTRAQVYATGNKWAIENFHATHD